MYLQPINSRSCGQHSVANLVNVNPLEVIKAFGKIGLTRTIDVHKALLKFGYDSPERLIKIKPESELPCHAILKITWDQKPTRSHWVFYCHGMILCSAYGCWSYDLYFKQAWKGRATSFLPVTKQIIDKKDK